MKNLSKLQALAEAQVSGEERARRQWFNNAEKLSRNLESMVTGNVLKKLLEDGKFPATESKAMIAAFNEFMNEFDDLKMAMLQEFGEDMNEEVAPMSDAQLEKAVMKIVRGAEKHLDHECRYKKVDVDSFEKEVQWVTQESTPAQSQKAAKTIAKLLTDAGIKGWKVKVVVRDDHSGDKSPWKTAMS